MLLALPAPTNLLTLRTALLFALSATVFATDDAKHPHFAPARAILHEHCFKCHSHTADKIKGGLVLDSRDALLAGGDSGPAIVPGDPTKSLLIEAVRYENEDLQMPPKGKKLSDAQITTLTEWVKAGAPWPEEAGQKMAPRPKGKITDEDRQWWAFRPLMNRPPPEAAWQDASGGTAPVARNPIDAFIMETLAKNGLAPAPPAEPAKLVRRLYFDLIGLPPTPEEVDRFTREAASNRPAAVASLCDALLADPRHGERWARPWLDLVRYAESDGYRIDDYRPNAWQYRDYVIRALNADKPYDRFVQEQIAGDELFPGDTDAQIATGFLCHWIYEYNNRDAVTQWSTILNDITDTTADVFMGLGVQCARCHDHKFDPILQKDYYRLQAFFAPIQPYAEAIVATAEQRAAFAEKFAAWEQASAAVRSELEALEAPYREKAKEEAIAKFPPETQALIRKPAAQRTPYEQQIVALAWRQVEYEWSDKRFPPRVKEPDKSRRNSLLTAMKQFDALKPAPLPTALAAGDVGAVAPPVTIPKKTQLGEIAPGFLTVLDEKPADIVAMQTSTGRRAALARWLTQPENPLTARVIVNRIWQQHFGRGLAVNASDFGKLGEPPSHPELLDWLARWFVENGWSLKKLHRLIVTSAAYQQGAHSPIAEQARLKDPENKLLWRGSTRRLEAEQIRDAMLAVTGELKSERGGEGRDADQAVRTIYTKVVRNTRDPVLDVFDAPEGFASMAQRNVTTTPTQSLLMINSKWSLARARAFAKRLRAEGTSDEAGQITSAFRLAYGRTPSAHELAAAHAFLDQQAKFTEAKKPAERPATFAYEKMPFREGRAAQFAPGTAQTNLAVPDSPALPGGDFTFEAFIQLKSIYPDAKVRTIAAHWDGQKGHPGWTLGVTGAKSRNKPQTLVLLLNGDQPWQPNDPTEPVFSGLHIELGKPYFVAVSVDLEDATEKGITFYAKDLSNDDQPLQIVNVAHTITSGVRSHAPFMLGARGERPDHLFDGLIDDARLSNIPLRAEQLLFTTAAVGEHTVGWWKFEADPSPYADASPRGHDISAKVITAPPEDPRAAALADFCHVLLNSNEFLYVD